MIVYSASKEVFCSDVRNNLIEDKINDLTLKKIGRRTGKSEYNSWKNSMQYMHNILLDDSIPRDSFIAIEYQLPRSSARVDFIITGKNESKVDTAIIIELKQWSSAKITDKQDVVLVDYGKTILELTHPSYQAWSYASVLRDFNSAVHSGNIDVIPCAYLHNCKDSSVLSNEFYETCTSKAPIFYQHDVDKLSNFIKSHVKYGDKDDVLYKIENGKIRPSKSLADELSSMMEGNEEFTLLDDQKVAFETAINLAKASSAKNKNVMIIQGGPGSGKSVLAINLLVKLTNLELVAQYVSKNAAPRAVYEQKLTKQMNKSRISNLFKGSGSFVTSEKNTFDVLIVDEAHRLNEKSGLYGNLGENQVREIIRSAFFSIFFIDEDQRVTFKDIGTIEEIQKWASKEKAAVHSYSLNSQFRCNGSDGYISWLDHHLQLKQTATTEITEFNYEFKVFEDPKQLHEAIESKNINNKSRMVAGYCWKWPSQKNPKEFDIKIGEYKARWNLKTQGSSWIIHPESVSEVGCIHTCQGLELEYVGVMIGPDLVVRNGKVLTDASQRASSDQSIKGFKSFFKKDPESATKKADLIIKNTYRTLMTRGMKGCYIYCTDPETRDYFKALIRT